MKTTGIKLQELRLKIAAARNTSTAEGVALQHLDSGDLDGLLRDSITELHILNRKMSAEIRIRLFPMLQEVKRRYDEGGSVRGIKGYHAYLESIGLNPSTVRSWERRRWLIKAKGVDGVPEIEIAAECVACRPKAGNPEAKAALEDARRAGQQYERQLQRDIEINAKSAEEARKEAEEKEKFDRRLKEDQEFRRQHEEEVRARERAREKEREYRQAAGPIRKYSPSDADIEEFISLGRKAAAAKYHPDRGGSQERMSQMNQVADWLEKLAADDFGWMRLTRG